MLSSSAGAADAVSGATSVTRRGGVAEPLDENTRFGGAGSGSGSGSGTGSGTGSGSGSGTGSGSGSGTGSGSGSGTGSGTGSGSGSGSGSGTTSRMSPSFAARRRTRSPWASTIPDEWLLTPMPRISQRSRTSLFSIPSSRASSYTRMFFGTVLSTSCFWSFGLSDPVIRPIGPMADAIA